MGYGADDRKSFRAAVVDRREGTLTVGDSRYRVSLLDQSATGFKLSTEDARSIPSMVDALLEMNDGLQHVVQIRHVANTGARQMLGIKLYETRLLQVRESWSDVIKQRLSLGRSLIALLLLAVPLFAFQSAPIQKRLSAILPIPFMSNRESSARTETSSPQRPSPPNLSRNHAFDFNRCVEDDAADWLELEATQRGMMRSIFRLCGGPGNRSLPSAERAFIDLCAQAAALRLLTADQHSRLENQLQQSLSGAALLETFLDRYSSDLTSKEFAEQFGALLLVSPRIASRYAISADVTAAIREQVDEAFQSSLQYKAASHGDVDAGQLVLEVSQELKQLKTSCHRLLGPQASR
jgi:hypothetical protein